MARTGLCTKAQKLNSSHPGTHVFSCMTGSPRGFQTWLNTTMPLLNTFQAVLEQDHRHSGFGQSQPCPCPLQQPLYRCNCTTVSHKGKSAMSLRSKGEIKDRSTDQGLQAALGWQQVIALHLQYPRPVVACCLFVTVTKEGKNVFIF